MPESEKHRKTSQRIAKKFNTSYNSGEGPDVKTSKVTIEVETAGTVADAKSQLQGHKGPVYVAGADSKATKKALKKMEGTTIGVMNPKGKVLKPSTRKK